MSHVRFDDGSILDASSLAAACKKHGTLLVLDVSQSCGAIPMDVRSLGADFVVCAGYKYLLSPFGTGFLWVKPQNADLLRPGPYNWLSQDVESFARLNYVDPRPARTLSRWDAAEASSIYNFNLTVMEASLRFVLNATPTLIHDHNQALISYFSSDSRRAIGWRVRGRPRSAVFLVASKSAAAVIQNQYIKRCGTSGLWSRCVRVEFASLRICSIRRKI